MDKVNKNKKRSHVLKNIGLVLGLAIVVVIITMIASQLFFGHVPGLRSKNASTVGELTELSQGWMLYTSPKYGFQLELPNEPRVFEHSLDDGGLSVITTLFDASPEEADMEEEYVLIVQRILDTESGEAAIPDAQIDDFIELGLVEFTGGDREYTETVISDHEALVLAWAEGDNEAQSSIIAANGYLYHFTTAALIGQLDLSVMERMMETVIFADSPEWDAVEDTIQSEEN